jgi:hypothetical protein
VAADPYNLQENMLLDLRSRRNSITLIV